jgi:site-specific DNA-methyltransferase (adenine-specific)/site-specific DNA-methyltransferase (cytosine-N4-specific)
LLAEVGGIEETPADDPGPQVDRAAELQAKWGTALGQVWEIPSTSVKGRAHRLLCGDCRNPDDIARLCIEKVQGCFTSPPYAEQRKDQYGGVPADEYVAWWEAVQAGVRGVLREDGSFFVNIKAHCDNGERSLYVMDLVLAMRRAWGWRYVDELCWQRASAPNGTTDRLRNQWEPIHHFALGDTKARFENVSYVSDQTNSGRGQKSRSGSGFTIAKWKDGMVARPSNVLVFNHNNEAADLGHPAIFPVALPDFFIRAYSDPGDVWLDAFVGSGTTFVAAEQNGRIGYGMEIAPKYVAVILERLTGLGLSPRLLES